MLEQKRNSLPWPNSKQSKRNHTLTPGYNLEMVEITLERSVPKMPDRKLGSNTLLMDSLSTSEMKTRRGGP